MTRCEVEDFLDAQVTRCVAAILGHKDREVARFLSSDVDRRLRSCIHREVHNFADAMRVVLGQLAEDDIELSRTYMDKLDAIHDSVVQP